MKNVNVSEMIKQVTEGADPTTVARSVYEQDGAQTSGPERTDPTPAQTAASFKAFADEMAKSTPYVDSSYIDTVVTQIVGGTSLADLQAMAIKNRDQYISDGAKVDAEGSFDTWDIIHRSLQKVATT